MKLNKFSLMIRVIVSSSQDLKTMKMFIQLVVKPTEAGIWFIHKPSNTALILSARDMDKKERRRYERE